MIKVPFMKMPESCSECPFGICKSSTPLSDREQIYQCNVDFWENGKYTRERKAPYDEYVVPVQCPLIDEDEDVCEKCLYAEETDGSHCYECVKGESKFKAESEDKE